MNWYRAKTILIVFFICMNAFLLANLIYSAKKSNMVTPEIISSTIEVLERNNIHIDTSLIPQKTVSVKSTEMKNIITDKSSFAATFCGGGTTMSQTDSYSGTGGKLEYFGDKFVFTPSVPFDNISPENAESDVKRVLADFNIDVSRLSADIYKDGENTIVSFTNEINDYKIFDSYIKTIINPNGNITSVEGVWFTESSKASGRISLKSVTGVLVDFILEPNRPSKKNIITKLELGYTASDDDIYHESTVLIPVWQITLDDGSKYCIDTRE